MNQFKVGHLEDIIIVGCGGTGANVARIIGRILFDMKRSRRSIPDVYIVDPDIVEYKNVGRQLFSVSEVGRYKAEAVARRINFALGLSFSYIPHEFSVSRIEDRYSNLIISCVDNYQARREIHKAHGTLIASGNHLNSGQVCIGNTSYAKDMKQTMKNKSTEWAYLPKEGLLYPDLLQPDPEPIKPVQPDASCADLIASGDQALLVNDWQATVIGGYVYKLLHRQPITTFLTYINAADGVVQNKLINKKELEVFI